MLEMSGQLYENNFQLRFLMSQKAISSLSQVFNRNSLFGEKLRSKAVCLCACIKLDSWELLYYSLKSILVILPF